MKLGDYGIGPVVTASGVRGFAGEGYWWHKLLAPIGLRFNGAIDIAKTITIEERLDPANGKGIMPLKKDGMTPKELLPKAIWFRRDCQVVLNAVGLSGMGLKRMLDTERYQRRRDAWILSFMATSQTASEREGERREFVRLMKPVIRQMLGLRAIEENFSCPNADVDHSHLVQEFHRAAEIMAELGMPYGGKFNQTLTVAAAKEITANDLCTFFGGYNTYPFDKMPLRIKGQVFGDGESPLTKRGLPQSGGASGGAFTADSMNWHKAIREAGITKAMIGGLGVNSPGAAHWMHLTINSPGAEESVVAIGSMSFMNPRKVATTIDLLWQIHLSEGGGK